ncbi:MAG: hypothetical protein GEV09_18320 [Pseudonocardiaceae bacterium]|nr:hypothetical protein [Pseudonocardiaceae bacterium]
MSGIDPAALKALAAATRAETGPCNRRCRSLARCAFGRADPPGSWCRERRPPRPGEYGREESGSTSS